MSTTTGLLKPLFTVYGSERNEVCARHGDPGSEDVAQVTCRPLAAARIYVIEARDNTRAKTGAYILYLQRLNKPLNGQPISIGRSLSEHILSLLKTLLELRAVPTR